MAPRMESPFKPARPALVEPIFQPLYSSALLTAATPEAKLFFWPVPAASQSDEVRTNTTDNKLANPKLFVVQGFRLHVNQDIALPETTGDFAEAIAELIHQYLYRFFVGTKDYFVVPMHRVGDGMGLWLGGMGAGAEATDEFIYAAASGVPHLENHTKLRKYAITIPPQQEFKASIERSPNESGAISGANVRIWNYLEGVLGREVQ